MKRLVERELPPQSVEGEARVLLAAVPPHRAAPGMKQRVRARLLAAPAAGRGLRFRPALVLALLGLASLAAAAGTAWVARQKSEPSARAAAPAAARARAATPAPPPSTPSPVETSEAPSTPPASEVPSAPQPSTSHGPSKAADELTEANLLFDATRALRHDGNPARAAELLAQYRRKFPRGALAEEALALSIEAAVASGDARSSALAKRYLKLYPHGHFVEKAKRALERDGE